jgi:hypothetical protein
MRMKVRINHIELKSYGVEIGVEKIVNGFKILEQLRLREFDDL